MRTPAVDLNADLGEGGSSDAQLLDVVTSTAVACGFHAGGPLVMVETARRAAERGVALGAHPSYDDREGSGRTEMEVPHDELVSAIVYQVGAMAAAAAAAGTRLRFVKPHGALYNRAAADPAVADAVVEAMELLGPSAMGAELALLCLPGSQLAERAERAGLRVYAEAFVDRAYTRHGTLASRSDPGSVLHGPAEVVSRAVDLVVHQRVVAQDGAVLEMQADSICIHGDTPGALQLARAVRTALQQAGVSIAPFVPG